MPTYHIYYLHSGEYHMLSEVGPTRAGRRVTLLLMDGAEVTGVIDSREE